MVIKVSVGSVASVLLLGVGATAQVVFDAADVSGAFQDGDIELPTEEPDGTTLTRPSLKKKGNLLRMCPCSDDQPEIKDIRGLSDQWFKDGTRPTSHGFSNMVWSWGQFIGMQPISKCFCSLVVLSLPLPILLREHAPVRRVLPVHYM